MKDFLETLVSIFKSNLKNKTLTEGTFCTNILEIKDQLILFQWYLNKISNYTEKEEAGPNFFIKKEQKPDIKFRDLMK